MFAQANQPQGGYGQPAQSLPSLAQVMACLLYTSDAADD